MSQLTVLQRDPFPAEQFDDTDQQYEAATLGMWTFLATEVLFFGVLFLGFYVYRTRWPDAFARGRARLKWWIGSPNTAILLGSSFFMAMAVHAAKHGDRRRLIRWLLITIALGVVFLSIKFTEYGIEYHEHLVPRLNYSDVSPKDKRARKWISSS